MRSLHVDCALLACYFMFSALEGGLGTCWIGLGRFMEDTDLLTLIGMPDGFQIMLKYKGDTGHVEFDDESGIFHGEVLDLSERGVESEIGAYRRSKRSR